MSEPSAINWKQYSLFGALIASIMVLLGFIAHALGIIEFRLSGDEEDTATPIGGASPSDIITTGAPIDSAPNPEASETTEPAVEGTWTAKYEDEILPLDSSPAGTDECTPLGFELDEVTDAGFAWRADAEGVASDDTDLIWDACTGYEDNVVYLSSGATSFGSLWAEGTVFDAAGCHADIEEFPLALYNTIDPASPSETWFTEGQVLCMRTSDEQVVIADLTTIEPATDDKPGIQATFEVTLWVRA